MSSTNEYEIRLMKYILSTLILLAIAFKPFAQGCSDAGFCSMGTLQSLNVPVADTTAEYLPHSARIAEGLGIGEQGVLIFQTTPEVNIGLGKMFSFQAKIPFTSVNGDLGKTNAFGDVSLAFSGNFKLKPTITLTATLGTKIPTNKADIIGIADIDIGYQPNNFPITIPLITFQLPLSLPMAYQTSLGTYDLVGGIGINL